MPSGPQSRRLPEPWVFFVDRSLGGKVLAESLKALGERVEVIYSEGIFVGYRHFDQSGRKPLFPFGYGLSYTKFKLGSLAVTPDTLAGDGPVTVAFDVTNVGRREGAEVVQVYVGDRHAPVPRPPKELKGFVKVT